MGWIQAWASFMRIRQRATVWRATSWSQARPEASACLEWIYTAIKLKREWFFEERDGNWLTHGYPFAARLAKLCRCGPEPSHLSPNGWRRTMWSSQRRSISILFLPHASFTQRHKREAAAIDTLRKR